MSDALIKWTHNRSIFFVESGFFILYLVRILEKSKRAKPFVVFRFYQKKKKIKNDLRHIYAARALFRVQPLEMKKFATTTFIRARPLLVISVLSLRLP